MQTYVYTLLENRPLTGDVYELRFQSNTPTAIAGQYILFTLGDSLKRAYSIAYQESDIFTFIIKQIEGGAGSTAICSLMVGTSIAGTPPIGHFTLRTTPVSKLFLATGTGFAPVYFQVRAALDAGITAPLRFVFGVRTRDDTFYREELDRLRDTYANFSYSIYLSREESKGYEHGYITNVLTDSTIRDTTEYYVCGSPAMVKEVRTTLESYGIEKERVFFEQY